MSKSLLFILIGNLFLIVLTMATRKRRRLNNLILTCTTIFLVLSIAEITYRIFFRFQPPYFEKSPDAFTYRPDPLLGVEAAVPGIWRARNMSPTGRVIYDVHYTIVADSIGPYGFNHRIGYLNPDSPRAGMIFLGCSFTFGEGVNDSETLPWQVGILTHRPTLNLGGIGWGIHHAYEIFEAKYAGTDNKGRVFVYTMIPDHVFRASGAYNWSAGPSFKLIGDSLVYSGPLPHITHKTAYYCSFFGCFQFIQDLLVRIQTNHLYKRVSPADYQKAILMIRKMDHDSRSTGAHLVVLFWDNITTPDDPNRRYRQLLSDKLDSLRQTGVDIIRVSDIINTSDPRYYIPDNGHPNAAAYDTVAKYLIKHE